MAYLNSDLATKLRRYADKLDASLGQPQNQREAVLRDIRVSRLRDLLSDADELPEIDGLSTDAAARRLVAFARMHAERIERRLRLH